MYVVSFKWDLLCLFLQVVIDRSLSYPQNVSEVSAHYYTKPKMTLFGWKQKHTVFMCVS